MSMDPRAERFQRFECPVDGPFSGQRLDLFLPQAMRRLHGVELSRRAVRRALQAGAVYLDGKRIRVASRPVSTGAIVAVVLEQSADGLQTAQATPPPVLDPSSILFEDKDLIIVDKPAGLPTQATQTDALGHALEMIRRYLVAQSPSSEPYLALHQRLDRGTSGALAVVKARRANAGMAAVFKRGAIEKTYRVVVADDGTAAWPRADGDETLTVDYALGKDGRRMIFDSGGQAAVTELRHLRALPHKAADLGSLHVLEARPKTGRKHQIRAHLAGVGLPIVGDRLYGPQAAAHLAPRPLLHAFALRFEHPVTHQMIEVQCPEPEDFLQFVEHGPATESP